MILDSAPAKERLFLSLGAISGFLGVAAGAFGAHALRDALPDDLFTVFETAVRYQMVHALALIVTALVTQRRRGRAAPAAGWLFALGTVVFSGSLYALSLTGTRAWGAVTPIGGVMWLLAWSLLAFAGARAKEKVVEIPGE